MKKVHHFIAIFIALSCVVSSCRQVCPPTETEILARQVKEYAQLHPAGFTIHIPDWTVPTTGIVVSYAKKNNSYNEQDVPSVIEHALHHDSIVGGWYHEEQNIYFYDSNRIFPEDSLEAAIAFGIANEQIAIYILSRDSTIYLNK